MATWQDVKTYLNHLKDKTKLRRNKKHKDRNVIGGCKCPRCGTETKGTFGIPCFRKRCPSCGSHMNSNK